MAVPDDDSIESLVARSSFGDREGRRARAATPDGAARAVYRRTTSSTQDLPQARAAGVATPAKKSRGGRGMTRD